MRDACESPKNGAPVFAGFLRIRGTEVLILPGATPVHSVGLMSAGVALAGSRQGLCALLRYGVPRRAFVDTTRLTSYATTGFSKRCLFHLSCFQVSVVCERLLGFCLLMLET